MGLDFARPVFVRAAPAPGDAAASVAAAAAAVAAAAAAGVSTDSRLDSPRKASVVPMSPLSMNSMAIGRHEWNEIRDACRTGDAAKLQALVLQGALVPRKLTGSPSPPLHLEKSTGGPQCGASWIGGYGCPAVRGADVTGG